jgi:hypothetical protein
LKQPITFRLESDLLSEFKKVCEDNYMSQTIAFELAIDLFIKQKQKNNNEKNEE